MIVESVMASIEGLPAPPSFVMAGLVPAIHVGMTENPVACKGRSEEADLLGKRASCNVHVDGRDKPGHDH